jgi:hypothetical protein
VLATSAGSYFFYSKFHPGQSLKKHEGFLNRFAETQVNKIVARKIYGTLEFDGLRLQFAKKRLALSAKSLTLLDQENNPILKASKPKLVFKWSGLLKPFTRFKKIQAETLELNLIKDKDAKWNLSKLFRTKIEPSPKIFIEEINLPAAKLKVSEWQGEAYQDLLNYQNLRVYWKRRGNKKTYFIDIDTDASDTDPLSKLSNHLRANGFISFYDLKYLANEKSCFAIDAVNLDLGKFLPLTDLIPGNKMNSKLSKLIHKYPHITSAHVSLINAAIQEANKKALDFFAEISAPDTALKTMLLVNEDLVIKQAAMNFSGTDLKISGNVKAWKQASRDVNLLIESPRINIARIIESWDDALKDKFTALNLDDSVKLNLQVQAKSSRPHLILKAESAKQNLFTDLILDKDKLLINSFSIAMDFSKILGKGWINRQKNLYELSVETTDFPISRIIKSLDELTLLVPDYRQIFLPAEISGYTNTKLKVVKSNGKPQIEGNFKLAKTNFISKNYPLQFKNLFADIEFKNKILNIKHLGGLVENDYFETRGMINYPQNKQENFNIEFASNDLSLATLIKTGLFKRQGWERASAAGRVKNTRLIVIKDNGEYNISGPITFDNASLRKSPQDPLLTSVYGNLSLNRDSVNIQNLKFKVNDADINITGSTDLHLDKLDLNLKAKNLKFTDLASYAVRYGQRPLPISVLSGNVNADLAISKNNGQKTNISGQLDLDSAALKLEKAKYPFSSLKGSLFIKDNTVSLHNVSGLHGSSSFDINGSIKNINSKDDLAYDLVVNSNLQMTEFREYVPSKIREFLDFRGFSPVKASIQGDKLKKSFNVEMSMDTLEYLGFSNWLMMNNKVVAGTLTTSFIITPNLISSKNTKLLLSRKNNKETDLPSEVRGVFEIKDWNNSKLSYYSNIKTPESIKQNFKNVEPHILTLVPFKILAGDGTLNCDTYGTLKDRQTICNITIDQATAKDYGIGDLYAEEIEVDLLSISDKPLESQFKFARGDWNKIPYKNLSLDMKAFGDMILINDLKAEVLNGLAWSECSFNVKTLESKFTIRGQNMPAHEIAQGIWKLGSEVPEGLIDGTFSGTTIGLEPDPMFFNLVGTANLIIKNGKLSTLQTMQKLLTAINSIKNFDLNNVFQILITYQGGLFDEIISSLDYDHGKVSTEKLLLKAPQIELTTHGSIDYSKDYLEIYGEGLIPKHSKSLLKAVGVGPLNLGNLASVVNLNPTGNTQKRFFSFSMNGPVKDMNKSVQSLRENFSWYE